MYIIIFAFAGLMSVTAQQLDYLHTALRALDVSSQNQYLIRGQPRFDKVTPDPLTLQPDLPLTPCPLWPSSPNTSSRLDYECVFLSSSKT